MSWFYLWELRITFWRMYWTSHQCRMTQIIIIILHLWHLARLGLGLYAYIRVLGLSGTYLMDGMIFTATISINQAITHDTSGILKFWLQILNLHQKLVQMTYNMSHFNVVFFNPKFGNHEIGSNMTHWQDMREPFSDSTYLYYFGHNSLLIT